MSKLATTDEQTIEQSCIQASTDNDQYCIDNLFFSRAELTADLERTLSVWLDNQFCQAYIEDTNIFIWLSQQISIIDELIEDQLNAIIHHKKFQKLEASWLSLWYLTDCSGKHPSIKIRFLDACWRTITKDQQRASEAELSALFALVYSAEFGIAGGEPFSVLIGDYQVSHISSTDHPYDDVHTLNGIAQVAAASFAPFICAAHPSLFGVDHFEQLNISIDFERVFQGKEYIRWQSLRNKADSKFLAITLPNILLRQPAHQTANSSLNFSESVSASHSEHYLWGNSAFALATVLIREFKDVGWFSHIRGVPRDQYGGGLVTAFAANQSEAIKTNKILTSTLITDAMDRELSNLGFLPLCSCYDTPFAAFYSASTVHKAKVYSSKSASANERISAMLQQLLCASRFAHYIKVMIRDKVGSFFSANDCERQLQAWLNQYATGGDNLKWETMAKYPLNEARVRVSDKAGSSGVYQCAIHLKPHYIVDQLVSELTLTTEINSLGMTTSS
ncbi:hypothetical protein SIN8267_00226 [Sinobacterium norvegicum]|uniref:Type VI secretion system contractile sheath large subunit n=1 Tax=Sinobacterium norvegicum TaxID=1641715 RepID=A0ABM9AAA9_9GAMM|nr:type VI secretion system contractile sheath large subunit [Sinobacterium norvegicum]CAH0990141.1 hypothetical protein SIN8267_00226 [Sinobacterium norvegicum]